MDALTIRLWDRVRDLQKGAQQNVLPAALEHDLIAACPDHPCNNLCQHPRQDCSRFGCRVEILRSLHP